MIFFLISTACFKLSEISSSSISQDRFGYDEFVLNGTGVRVYGFRVAAFMCRSRMLRESTPTSYVLSRRSMDAMDAFVEQRCDIQVGWPMLAAEFHGVELGSKPFFAICRHTALSVSTPLTAIGDRVLTGAVTDMGFSEDICVSLFPSKVFVIPLMANVACIAVTIAIPWNVVKRVRYRYLMSRDLCVKCKYDRSNIKGRCPECGHASC